MKAVNNVIKFFNAPMFLTAVAVIAIGASLSVPLSASAATLDISGTVAAQCSVSVTDLGVSLDLVNGETSRNVASISETCNDPNGYTVSFSSADGQLNGPTGFDEGYTINYDTLSAADLAAAAQSVAHAAPAWNSSNNLQVNLAGNSQLAAGTYTDTITISIAGQ